MRTNSGPTPSPVRAVYGRPDFRPRPQGAQENSERETQDRRAGTKKNGQEAAYGCDRTACRRPVRCGRSTAVPTHLSGDFDVFRRFFED